MSKMKIVLIFILLLTRLSFAMSQDDNVIKERIKKGKLTELPYISTANNLSEPWYISEKYRKGISVFVYDDLRGINRQIVDYCAVYNVFNSINENYKIFLIVLGEYDNSRYLLVTYDLSGKFLSYIEVCYMFDVYFNFKQWKLNKDMSVEIYTIKVQGEERIDPHPRNVFEELKAQRIDEYYQIDSLGNFKKVKEVFYKPEVYPKSYFKGEERPIWNGKEVVEKERVY